MFTRIRAVLWGSVKRRLVTAAAALVLLAGMTVGGVAIANSLAHASALDVAQQAHEGAVDARAAYRALVDEATPATVGTAAAFHEDVAPLTEQLAGAVDDEALEHLVEQLAEVDAARLVLEERAAPNLEPIGPAPAASLSTVELTAEAEALDRAAESYRQATRALQGDVDALAGSIEAAAAALVDVASSAPEVAEAVVGSLTLADQATRDAAIAAADAAADAGDGERIARLVEYLEAIAAARASQAAAEEAAQAAATGSSGGGSGPGGGSPGGGTPGGGSPGGGSPGGGTAPDTARYADPRGPYSPGCSLGPEVYRHDPGPGGTAVIASVSVPYDYRISGNYVIVYACW